MRNRVAYALLYLLWLCLFVFHVFSNDNSELLALYIVHYSSGSLRGSHIFMNSTALHVSAYWLDTCVMLGLALYAVIRNRTSYQPQVKQTVAWVFTLLIRSLTMVAYLVRNQYLNIVDIFLSVALDATFYLFAWNLHRAYTQARVTRPPVKQFAYMSLVLEILAFYGPVTQNLLRLWFEPAIPVPSMPLFVLFVCVSCLAAWLALSRLFIDSNRPAQPMLLYVLALHFSLVAFLSNFV